MYSNPIKHFKKIAEILAQIAEESREIKNSIITAAFKIESIDEKVQQMEKRIEKI